MFKPDMQTADSDHRSRTYEQYLDGFRSGVKGVERFASRGPYLRDMIRRYFPSSREVSIIDLGCGHGALIYYAREAGYRDIIGYDRSPQQVAEAKEAGIPGVLQGDLMEPLQAAADQATDVVVTLDVIEHLRREELIALSDEVHRVLKPGGRWIIHTVNAESPFFGRIRYGDFTHEIAFTQTSIRQALAPSGFRHVDSYENLPVVHGFKSAMRYSLWRLFRFAFRVCLAAETGDFSGRTLFSQGFVTVAVR